MEAITEVVQSIGAPVFIVLMTVSIWAVLTALYVPGTGVPEGVGAVSFGLALPGLFGLNASVFGLMALLAAVGCFTVILFDHKRRWLQWVGFGLHLLGLALLFPEMALIGRSTALVMTAIALGYQQLILMPGVRAQDRPGGWLDPTSRVGEEGVATRTLDPEGTVRVAGELWSARADTPIYEGERVRVRDLEGNRLVVEPVSGNGVG